VPDDIRGLVAAMHENHLGDRLVDRVRRRREPAMPLPPRRGLLANLSEAASVASSARTSGVAAPLCGAPAGLVLERGDHGQVPLQLLCAGRRWVRSLNAVTTAGWRCRSSAWAAGNASHRVLQRAWGSVPREATTHLRACIRPSPVAHDDGYHNDCDSLASVMDDGGDSSMFRSCSSYSTSNSHPWTRTKGDMGWALGRHAPGPLLGAALGRPPCVLCTRAACRTSWPTPRRLPSGRSSTASAATVVGAAPRAEVRGMSTWARRGDGSAGGLGLAKETQT
jgi:hypothetical protein